MRFVTLLVIGFVIASAGGAHADDPLYTCKQPAAGANISVQFAPDSSIYDLAIWVAGFTCKTVVFDSDVKARVPRVTIVAPKPMTTKQALQLFVDAVEATGLVVQQKKDTILLKLGPNMPRTCPAIADTAPSSTVPPAKPPVATATTPDPSEDELQKLMDSEIKKTDETHVQLSRRMVDTVLANPMAVAKGARVVPAVKDGKPDGFKLYAIRPSSLYARIGFMNGDTIRRVNGQELTSAERALDVYTKLRDASTFTVDIERRGKAMTLTIKIITADPLSGRH